jgi:hypothetical protein
VTHKIGFNLLPAEVEDICGPTFNFDPLLYILSGHTRKAKLVDCLRVFDRDGLGRLNVQLVRQVLCGP